MDSHTDRAEVSLVHAVDLTSGQIHQAAQILGLLAEPSRLAILWTLTSGPLDVTALTAKVGASRTSVSQHLAKLRAAELVTVEARGRRKVYSVRGGHVERLMHEALNQADHAIRGEPPHR